MGFVDEGFTKEGNVTSISLKFTNEDILCSKITSLPVYKQSIDVVFILAVQRLEVISRSSGIVITILPYKFLLGKLFLVQNFTVKLHTLLTFFIQLPVSNT